MSFIKSAAFLLSPLEFFKDLLYALIFLGPASTKAKNPLADSVPTIVAMFASFCSLVMPFILCWNCPIREPIPTNSPLASDKWIPSFSISLAVAFDGLARRMKDALKAVPACDPSRPELDMISIAADVSSIDTPSAFAGAPAYLSASPMYWISAALSFADTASKSATCEASDAFKPNALIADAITVAVVAISAPLASAALITPGIASIVCFALKPNAASSSIPLATSFALLLVFAPRSTAWLDIAFKSLLLA